VDRVVIVAQEAEVHAEVVNQIADHQFTDRGRITPRRLPSTWRPAAVTKSFNEPDILRC